MIVSSNMTGITLEESLAFYILESGIDMKKILITEIIIYFLCVTLAALLWSRPIVLFLCYIFISIFMLYKWHAKSDLTFYFVAFVLGPLGELVAIYFGAWEYSKPLYFIPIWLPFLWGMAALFMKKLSETLIAK
jgi:hypothetical protein